MQIREILSDEAKHTVSVGCNSLGCRPLILNTAVGAAKRSYLSITIKCVFTELPEQFMHVCCLWLISDISCIGVNIDVGNLDFVLMLGF